MEDDELTPEQVAEKEAAERTAAEEAERLAAEEAKKNTPENKSQNVDDEKAKLLKDVMKQKEAARKAAEELAAVKKQFEGIDPDAVKKLLQEQTDRERSELERKGEYDRIVKQMREDAEKRQAEWAQNHDATKNELEAARREIDGLTIGSTFANSKFISDNTVLTGPKAQRLYGEYFDRVDGRLVAYDKPRGASERTPLVDSASGEHLDFEAAIEKIMRSDADFERIAKSKMKTGSQSQPSDTERRERQPKDDVTGVSRIALALAKQSGK